MADLQHFRDLRLGDAVVEQPHDDVGQFRIWRPFARASRSSRASTAVRARAGADHTRPRSLSAAVCSSVSGFPTFTAAGSATLPSDPRARPEPGFVDVGVGHVQVAVAGVQSAGEGADPPDPPARPGARRGRALIAVVAKQRPCVEVIPCFATRRGPAARSPRTSDRSQSSHLSAASTAATSPNPRFPGGRSAALAVRAAAAVCGATAASQVEVISSNPSGSTSTAHWARVNVFQP
jgi:hypothetical protein